MDSRLSGDPKSGPLSDSLTTFSAAVLLPLVIIFADWEAQDWQTHYRRASSGSDTSSQPASLIARSLQMPIHRPLPLTSELPFPGTPSPHTPTHESETPACVRCQEPRQGSSVWTARSYPRHHPMLQPSQEATPDTQTAKPPKPTRTFPSGTQTITSTPPSTLSTPICPTPQHSNPNTQTSKQTVSISLSLSPSPTHAPTQKHPEFRTQQIRKGALPGQGGGEGS